MFRYIQYEYIHQYKNFSHVYQHKPFMILFETFVEFSPWFYLIDLVSNLVQSQ